MKTIKLFSILILTTLVVFTACQKSETTEPTEVSILERQNGRDYSASENLFAEAYHLVEEEAQKEITLRGFACPMVTVSPQGNVFPKTLVLDFGTSCTTRAGVTASGKITAVFSGKLRQVGATISVTFQNFVYKGYGLSGTYKVTYVTATSLMAQITGGTITTPDNKNITYQANLTLTQIEGMSTTFQTNGEAGILDDVYSISGSASGKDAANTSYTVTIITPLVKKLNCQWIVSGAAELKVTSQATKKLDFGTGACDNQATLTVGRLTTAVTLP